MWGIGVNVASAALLSDITDSRNREAIQYLSDKNIIGGYPDGTFRPQNTVNRAELVKILVGGKGATPTLEQYHTCFPDVKKEWFAPFVCYAKEHGWVSGYPDGTFRPSAIVNKAEAIKMIVTVQRYAIPASISETSFGDVDTTAWYAPFVQAAHEKGILEEEDGILGVSSDMRREAVAEIIYRLVIMYEQGLPRFGVASSATSSNRNNSWYSSSASSQSSIAYTFPLNLLENQEWKIQIQVTEDTLKDHPIFTIERKGEKFTVKAEQQNLRTGELESYQSSYDYQAGFEKRKILDDITFFQVEECHYRYEYIHEDFRCSTFVIPYDLTSGNANGSEIYMSDYSQSVLSSGTYTVTILNKSQKNVPCNNVKAETYGGYKIYYLPDSEFFQTVERFACFQDEQDAVKAGYTKSFR